MIGSSDSIIWVFDIIDRFDKQAHLFCVMNDSRKHNLLPLVNTISPINGNKEDSLD